MTGATITNLIIGVAVLAWVVSRQLTTRRLRLTCRLNRAARREAAGQLPLSEASL